jgi:hypothetical protein
MIIPPNKRSINKSNDDIPDPTMESHGFPV